MKRIRKKRDAVFKGEADATRRPLSEAVATRIAEIALHCCVREKVIRQHSPLTACPAIKRSRHRLPRRK